MADDPQFKVGPSVIQTIDGTERRLDATPLSEVCGYPMRVQLRAVTEGCYIRQGSATVTLHATAAQNASLGAGEWQLMDVTGPGDAHVAVERTGAGTGTLVATRIDRVA